MQEYFILGANYSNEENHLEWVFLARWDQKQTAFVAGAVVGRNFVYDLIEKDAACFSTVVYDQRKQAFGRGAKVIQFGEGFLTTESDKTEANNLESLPRFEMNSKEIEASLKKLLRDHYPTLEEK